jgi:hypothetical protein
MLLDDELGMISDARSNASATADADAELEPSAECHSNARDVEHGAKAVSEAAGAADTAGCAAAAQSIRNRAHSCVLAMHTAKKRRGLL